jgi:hypothetical protein
VIRTRQSGNSYRDDDDVRIQLAENRFSWIFRRKNIHDKFQGKNNSVNKAGLIVPFTNNIYYNPLERVVMLDRQPTTFEDSQTM